MARTGLDYRNRAIAEPVGPSIAISFTIGFHLVGSKTMRYAGSLFRARSIAAIALLVPIAALPQTIRQYQLQPREDGQGFELSLREVPRPTAGPNDVLVRIHATSLNGGYDLEMMDDPPDRRPDRVGGIPLADGAGEVIEIGSAVTRFGVGDRVIGIFMPNWIDGDPTLEALSFSRGGNAGGMLSEVIVTNEQALVRIPAHLSYEEAATLPTAGVVAWAGLFKSEPLEAGEYVLLEGTGGVSTFGLLFSVAAGARPIITSSSDAKLARAAELGAFGTVNYRSNPEWQDEVRELTGGVGVKHVLEVGGSQTIGKAFEAIALDGHIALIGTLSGFPEQIPLGPLFGNLAHLSAHYVGSRADFEAMNAFVEEHEIRPLIDRVFEFEDAAEAFDLMENGDYMSKIVIRL
jgi:NADPH:quinone reductase-like Zn-dependent oxidoreductase